MDCNYKMTVASINEEIKLFEIVTDVEMTQ